MVLYSMELTSLFVERHRGLDSLNLLLKLYKHV